MKLKLLKFKAPKSLDVLKYFYILIILIIIVGINIMAWFLYKNLYQTISQTDKIILLKQEVAPDTINITKVETVLGAIDDKINLEEIDYQNIKNPFRSYDDNPIDSTPLQID